MKIEARPWTPQDLLDDLQSLIDEEPNNYLNTRRTTLETALAYLKEHFAEQEQPLTMAELREMNGETVYCLELNTDVKISAPQVGIINIHYAIPGEWGTYKAKGMTLYRSKPKET